jgi:hypothetical protein
MVWRETHAISIPVPHFLSRFRSLKTPQDIDYSFPDSTKGDDPGFLTDTGFSTEKRYGLNVLHHVQKDEREGAARTESEADR